VQPGAVQEQAAAQVVALFEELSEKLQPLLSEVGGREHAACLGMCP
jgi:hypothetical protein